MSESSAINKKYEFVPSTKGSRFVGFSLDYLPRVEMELVSGKNGEMEVVIVLASEFIAIKSYKAKGKRVTTKTVKKIRFIDPLPYKPPENEGNHEKEIVEIPKEKPPVKQDPETGQLELF